MAYSIGRECFHRWSKNGICKSPGCGADKKHLEAQQKTPVEIKTQESS